MKKLIERLAELVERRDRFTYDLRGECMVDRGIVCAYQWTQDSQHFTDAPAVILHALGHDGIVGAWKNPEDGKVYYDSCRLFTDLDNALRFAREQHQRSVFNLNRDEEVPVDDEPLAA